MTRRFGLFIVAAVAGALAAAAPGAASDVSIKAFAGHYVGTGIAKNDLSQYFGMTVRDLDVRIIPQGDGFALTWTTVIRRGGDPDDPDVKRKTASLSFVPTDRPHVFRAATVGDPLAGTPFVWARIAGQTLTVHSLVIHDDGSYEIQSYDRTLTGSGMELRFTRVRDGEPVRTVTGNLAKVGN